MSHQMRLTRKEYIDSLRKQIIELKERNKQLEMLLKASNWIIPEDDGFVSVRRETQENIIDAITGCFRVSFRSIQSHSRFKDLVTVRFMLCYLLYSECMMTMEAIGELLERDHTTILNAIESFVYRIDKNNGYPDYVNKYNEFKQYLITIK